MWANAQHDGRPAEYRWRPLFNAAVWLTPTTRVPCWVDIQSVAAEIRRGKKKDRRIERNYRAKYNGPLLHRAAIIRRQAKIRNPETLIVID